MEAGSPPTAPGLILVPRQGSPRLLGRMLLEHLGLSELPPHATSVSALLAAAGFRPRSRLGDGSVWERDGRAVLAGEEPLEDGAKVLWTFPVAWDEASVRQHVRYLGMASHDLRGS